MGQGSGAGAEMRHRSSSLCLAAAVVTTPTQSLGGPARLRGRTVNEPSGCWQPCGDGVLPQTPAIYGAFPPITHVSHGPATSLSKGINIDRQHSSFQSEL